ncbi:copper transport protein ATOX1 isoform X1 [Tupaia chinensis]|uniref:copper transport protein ATOX1 isoform X1 n=1 Tax=Tupaia chinensis TaxID=246437 RepID=UPI000FFBAD47|nr:copper transport protein ATOX1 isoform X1 [Tupaia chinensis]
MKGDLFPAVSSRKPHMSVDLRSYGNKKLCFLTEYSHTQSSAESQVYGWWQCTLLFKNQQDFPGAEKACVHISVLAEVKHEFSVDMTCEGCADAVSRVLNKLGGVKHHIDLPNKKVCIESDHSVDTLLETLKKTGKAVSYLNTE